MTTDELLEIIKERGLEIVVGMDGQPRLRGDNDEKTPKLIRVLKLEPHRSEIIRRYRKKRWFYRIVKLKTDDPFGEIEKVVEEYEITGTQPGHVERLNKIADADLSSRYAVCWRSEAVVHA